MWEGHYLVLNNRWRNLTLVKLMKLCYADLFSSPETHEINEQMLLRVRERVII